MATFEDYFPAPVGGASTDFIIDNFPNNGDTGQDAGFTKNISTGVLGTSEFGSILYPSDRNLMPSDTIVSIQAFQNDYNVGNITGRSNVNYDDEATFISDNSDYSLWRLNNFVDNSHGVIVTKTVADNYDELGVDVMLIPVLNTDFPVVFFNQPYRMRLYNWYVNGTRARNWDDAHLVDDGASETGYYLRCVGWSDQTECELMATRYNANEIVGSIPGWYATADYGTNSSNTISLDVMVTVERATTFYPIP